MNHTIAKIRNKGKGSKYRKILSDVTLYALPDDLSPHVAYSPSHNLDEDCWFGIESFSEKEYCLEILKSKFISTEYKARLKQDEAEKIDFIFTYQDDNTYYFQNITKSQLQRRRYINLGDEYTFRENSKDISISSVPDAIYIIDLDTLYFKRLSSISRIFKGIDSLYREATQEETTSFLENNFVCLQDGFSAEKVKQANRKRIAMAVDTINKFDDEQTTVVFGCIKDYYPHLMDGNVAFKIATENDLKLLLYGIEQRFYTTPDGREKRIANSVIPIN